MLRELLNLLISPNIQDRDVTGDLIYPICSGWSRDALLGTPRHVHWRGKRNQAETFNGRNGRGEGSQ